MKEYLLHVLFIGMSATIFIDFYAFILQRYFNIPSLNYQFIGRWLVGISHGQFVHHKIMQSPNVRFEKYIGWFSHYVIGIMFSALFIMIVSTNWLISPELFPALFFGTSTVIFPFFLMQPCLGFGIAASQTPFPRSARLKSISTHFMFGLGLYFSTILLHLFDLI